MESWPPKIILVRPAAVVQSDMSELWISPTRWQSQGRIRRYRHVARVLARHGFGYLVDELRLSRLVPFHWGLFGHRRKPTPYTQPEHLRLVFEELGVGFIKLGQMLSTRSDLLAPEFVTELAKLRDAVPSASAEIVNDQVRRELGKPPSELFTEFDSQPLGSASIGQVQAARLKTGEEVVLKVQRPGVEEQAEMDIAVLSDLAEMARKRTDWGRLYDLPAMVDEFAQTLRDELDYVIEAANAERIRRAFATEPALHVPKIYPELSTRRVLTMERIRGIKLDDLDGLRAAGIGLPLLGDTLLGIIARMIFEQGFFHADPHPGNFLIEPNGTIGMLDYGMVGVLDEETREQLIMYFGAIARHNLDGAVDRLSALGIIGPGTQIDSLKRDLARLASRFWQNSLESAEAGAVVNALLDLARRQHLRLPASLALMSKTLIMHEENARKLEPELNLSKQIDPHVERAVKNLITPERIARRAKRAMEELAEFAPGLPRRADRLLRQLERGEATLGTQLRKSEDFLSLANRLATRIVLAVLAAGFVVGIAVLLQVYHSAPLHPAIGWLLTGGLVAVVGLSVWLVGSILRGRV